MKKFEIELFSIEKDGLPDMDDPDNTGRIVIVTDAGFINGWPLENGIWEASENFIGVTFEPEYWGRLPVAVWSIGKSYA